MDYRKIHDSIIDRAKSRKYNSSDYHNHHIIPKHEDLESTEVVPLTLKEHYIVHLLRYKFTGTVGNYAAYFLLKFGKPTVDIASKGGKKGGKRTKEAGSGIFSSNWDRGKFTKHLWETGILSKESFTAVDRSAAGRKSAASGKGIYDPSYDRSAAGKTNWQNLDEQIKKTQLTMLRQNAIIGGEASKNKGTNFTTWDKDKQKEAASKGGKTASKIQIWTNGFINKRSHECPGEGWRKGFVTRKKNG